MQKRVVSFILSVLMLVGTLPFVPVSVFAANNSVILNLSNADSIVKLGLAAASSPKMGGNYSALWQKNSPLKELTACDIDLSCVSSGYIEYWVYARENTKMKYSFIFTADNKATPYTDYYYATDIVDWTGWKKAAIKLPYVSEAIDSTDNMSWAEYDKYQAQMQGRGVLIPCGKPLDIKMADKLTISKVYGGQSDSFDTDLYFGNIEYHSEKSPDAELFENNTSNNDDDKLILADFSDKDMAAKTPWEYCEEMSAIKIAAPNLDKSFTIEAPADWSEYNTINIETNSNINDRNRLSFVVYSNNSATSGDDYWRGELIYNWADKWKTLKFTFDAASLVTDMKVSRTPLGFDKISKVLLSTNFNNLTISDDKEIYIRKIYLSKTMNTNPEYNNETDYIPAAQMEGVDKSIIDNLKLTDKRKQHPRLLTDSERLQKNTELYKSGKNVYLTNTMKNIFALSDQIADKDTTKYGLADGTRLVTTEFDAIRYLSVAYAVSGEPKYRKRLWAALKEMASWPDWAPEHLLRTCEAAFSFGLAYDLCYDTWTEEEKRIIRNAIVKHGIMPALKQWRVGEYPSDTKTNWQLVCAGGVGFAAMAIIDEPGYLDLCTEIVSRTVETIPLGLEEYRDNGSYPEGIGYWKYATPYLFDYIQALSSTLGTDYGLSEYTGLSETGFFPIISSGPNGTYNFSDGALRVDGIKDACMFYLAKRYNEPVLADFYVQSTMTTGEWDSFIAYDDTVLTGEDYRSQMPLDYIYGGAQQNVYTRSSWDGRGSVWLAYKGRYGNAAHSDLDAGSFILDMQGIRWFADLGSGDYDAEGYFDVDDLRWDYYRKRAEAHNTLVINPDKEPDQAIDAISTIEKFEHSDYASYGVIDMTKAYPDADEVIRGIGLVNNRSEVIIQDEIKTSKAIDLYSFFTTEHAVEISADKKTAHITAKSGEKISATIQSNVDATWATMEPKPLATSPDPEGNYTNKGGTVSLNIDSYTKLYIHLNSVQNPVISVKISSELNSDAKTDDEILPIDNWDSYLKPGVCADNLYVDGIEISGFTPGNSFYTLNGIIGEVSLDYDSDKYVAEYTQATKIGDMAKCVLTDKQSGKTAVYYVDFKEIYTAVNPDIFTQVQVTKAEQSLVPEAANGPDKSYDGDFTTVSTFEGDGEIVWTLSDTKEIDRVLLAFSKGDQRNAIFDIYVSIDNKNWDKVYSGMSSGNSTGLEAFEFGKTVSAGYVKFSGHGNSINGWNAVSEVFVPEAIPEFADIDGHWAEKSIKRMRDAGLIKGTSKTSFSPQARLTVGQLLLMIERFMGISCEDDTDFKAVINAATQENIIPKNIASLTIDREVTRQELAAILSLCYQKLSAAKLVSVNLSRFTDEADIATAYREHVENALAARLLNGVSKTEFAPLLTVTRAQAATVIERLYIINK